MLKHWLSNLRSGFNVLIFAPVGRQDFHVSLGFLLSALALSIGLFASIDYLQLDHVRFQDIRGSALLGLYFGLGALIAVVSAHLEDDYPQLPVLLTVVLSCLPFMAIVVSLFPYDWVMSTQNWWPLAGLLLYACAVLLRCLRLAFYRPRVTTLLVPAVALVLIATHSWQRFYFPTTFDAFNPNEFEQGPEVDLEHTLYQQQRLVEQQLDNIEPSVAGETDYFFVGFGGSDRQTVFESETLYAQEVLARLFGSGNRSITLFNNVDKLDQQPIANTYNLTHAINGLAARMDLNDDVLVMLLTSHGGEDATLAIELESARLKKLEAPALRAALDDSGIQWRILIVSACYSGSFIDELANERTLLITAASAERNSFGCSSDRELTVFGEALFKHALSGDANLVEAFDAAQELIRLWETEAELPTSNPQIRIGRELRTKLGLPLAPAPPPSSEEAATDFVE